MDAATVLNALLVGALLALLTYAMHLRDCIWRLEDDLGKRLTRANASLQNESKERGKLSRRLAQAETKIGKIKRAANHSFMHKTEQQAE